MAVFLLWYTSFKTRGLACVQGNRERQQAPATAAAGRRSTTTPMTTGTVATSIIEAAVAQRTSSGRASWSAVYPL